MVVKDHIEKGVGTNLCESGRPEFKKFQTFTENPVLRDSGILYAEFAIYITLVYYLGI